MLPKLSTSLDKRIIGSVSLLQQLVLQLLASALLLAQALPVGTAVRDRAAHAVRYRAVRMHADRKEPPSQPEAQG